MDTFVEKLDSKDLTDISLDIQEYFKKAKEYPNRLKIAIAASMIISESLDILSSIDRTEYLSDIKNKLEDISHHGEESKAVFDAHFELDKVVIGDLGETGNPGITAFEDEIENMLQRLDSTIKRVIEIRDRLPISEIAKWKEE